MIRKAFIGLSSPIGYDYRNKARKAESDLFSSPNPILDSPFGTLLLYDELWFLCESLCPENMRDLEYVKFLDKYVAFSNISNDEYNKISKETEAYWRDHSSVSLNSEGSPYRDSFRNAGVTWDSAIDNHTHGIRIGDIVSGGNPTHEKLLTDILLMEKSGMQDLELITNSFTHRYLSSSSSMVPKSKIAEYMTINNIPNYLSTKGPYHSVVDDARNNRFLIEFRNWVSDASTKTEKEIIEAKKSVEAAINEIQNKLFIKHLDERTFYKSIGKSVVGDAIGLLVPGTGTLATLVDEFRARRDKEKIKWQGFLVSMRGKL